MMKLLAMFRGGPLDGGEQRVEGASLPEWYRNETKDGKLRAVYRLTGRAELASKAIVLGQYVLDVEETKAARAEEAVR